MLHIDALEKLWKKSEDGKHSKINDMMIRDSYTSAGRLV